MTLLHSALAAITEYRDERQAQLDHAAREARLANLAAYRNRVLDGIGEDSPLRPIAELVSATVTIGRDSDGYPQVSVPPETVQALRLAKNAELWVGLELGGVSFSREFSVSHDLTEWHADYEAWNAAKEYRKRNQ